MIQLVQEAVVQVLPVQKKLIAFFYICFKASQKRCHGSRSCYRVKETLIPVKRLVAVAGNAKVSFTTSFLFVQPAPLILVPVPVAEIQIQQTGPQKGGAVNTVIIVFIQFL